MKKDALKWIVIGGALSFVILYGIEVSTSGIERIYGPIEGAAASAVSPVEPDSERAPETEPEDSKSSADDEATRRIAALEKELKEVRRLAELNADERLPGVDGSGDAPAVNRLADGTAGFLQSVTTGGIRFFVSLFDSVTD